MRASAGGDMPLASFPIHDVKQRSLLRSRARCCARVLCSSLSLVSVGWVERQRYPSPALAGSMGFAQGAQPILRNSYLPVSSFPGTFLPGFLLPSQLPIPDRGDGGAPGGGILYPVARVIARRHVCEAWPSRATGTAPRGAPP